MENWRAGDRGEGNRRLMAVRIAVCTALTLLATAVCSPAALAYIGPGAGFVFVGSFLILLVTIVLVISNRLRSPPERVYALFFLRCDIFS